MSKISGFSLVELLITLALSSIVALSLFQFYLQVYRNSLQIDAVNQIHENTLTFRHLLAQRIQSAGVLGCRKISDSMSMGGDISHRHDIQIIPYNSVLQHKGIPKAVKQRMQPDTDLIWVQRVIKPMQIESLQHNGHIRARGSAYYERGDYVALSDCEKVLFSNLSANTSIEPNTQTTRWHIQDLSHYQRVPQLYIGKWNSEWIFIGNTGRTWLNQPIYSLYAKAQGADMAELIEGVSQLHVVKSNQIITATADFMALSTGFVQHKSFEWIWRIR